MAQDSLQGISITTLLQPGRDALRRNWRLFVTFQVCALLLVIAYFNSEAVKAWCERLTALKQASGLLFAAIAAVAAGVLLPELAKRLLGQRAAASTGRDLLIQAAFFAGGGILIDLQFRAMTLVFGGDNQLGTVVRKVLADQFITSPIYGVPYWVVLFGWKANHFRVRKTLRTLGLRWYVQSVVPLLLPNWFYWFPMTAMIYSLPSGLQFSLFCLALAAWSLIVVCVASGAPAARPEPALEAALAATALPAASRP